MPEGLGPQELLSSWRAGQEAFWTAAAAGADAVVPSEFAEPDWQVFDSWLEPMLKVSEGERGPAWEEATRAAQSWRNVVVTTLGRVTKAFDIQRKALQGTGAVLDWRILRDRWFGIAEVEFINALRSEPFLEAQRDGLRAGIRLWSELPESARATFRAQRRAGGAATRTTAALGAQMIQIANTPRDLVWQDGKVTLWRYHPLASRNPDLPPIVLCHGLIGRQTMTDLRPERSLVRNLLAAGSDVLVVDWGDADVTDERHGLDHYVGRMIPDLLEAACAACDVEKVVLCGICQGGTLVGCHAARDASRLAGLITAVAPFDFDVFADDADPAHGMMNLWIRSFEPEDISALIDMEGNLSGEFIGLIFQQLNPVRTLAKYTVTMVETAADPHGMASFLAMEAWLMDRPDLPGKLAKEWLVDLYQDNRLAKGDLEIMGTPVDLSTLRLPVLNIFATRDHITPAPCALALARLAPYAPMTQMALPTGHIGAFVGAKSQSLLAPRIVAWLLSDTITTA
ncbi:MAG: alpha/beta fold hydrolase [Paracoccaceae bacterium]